MVVYVCKYVLRAPHFNLPNPQGYGREIQTEKKIGLLNKTVPLLLSLSVYGLTENILAQKYNIMQKKKPFAY